jgi:hypothetical protein
MKTTAAFGREWGRHGAWGGAYGTPQVQHSWHWWQEGYESTPLHVGASIAPFAHVECLVLTVPPRKGNAKGSQEAAARGYEGLT